jgi:glyoxylase-like metal-dependent hydrolase (beta-lactamase superfamily II)
MFAMEIRRFTFNPFQTNCYVCHDGKEAALVDPSSATEEEHRIVERYIDENGLEIRHLLLTHAHIDHIFGCAHFARRYRLGWQMHREDVSLLSRAEDQAEMFGVAIERPPEPEIFLSEGDRITIGKAELEVLFTPGHSPGSICFYERVAGLVVSGDVLFLGSIGRTDLWRGSLPELMQSIFQKLVPLGDDVRVFPGHGPETTIGRERAANPFLTHGFAGL